MLQLPSRAIYKRDRCLILCSEQSIHSSTLARDESPQHPNVSVSCAGISGIGGISILGNSNPLFSPFRRTRDQNALSTRHKQRSFV
jgi:hypothetical protein